MFIGRLAELTGCTPKAIRLYEQMGLINEPERKGRYRLYNAHHLEIVHLIRKAQRAGFRLAEMNPLIAAKNKLKCFPLELANLAVDDKRRQVQERIAELQALDLHLIELKSGMDSLFAPRPVAGLHKVDAPVCAGKQTLAAKPPQATVG